MLSDQNREVRHEVRRNTEQCLFGCGWFDAESFPSAGADVDRL